jgi:Cu2+-exporting ATPase
VAVASGAITFTYWWFSGDKEHALIRTATVLIIACPHALGLAIPLVIAISTSLGAQNGLLIKDRLGLERARNLDVVIFDKTGTLTRGSPAVSGVATVPGTNDGDLLAHAAAPKSTPNIRWLTQLSPKPNGETCLHCTLPSSKRYPVEEQRR